MAESLRKRYCCFAEGYSISIETTPHLRYECNVCIVGGNTITIVSVYLPSLSLHVHDQLRREGPRDHEVLLVKVSIRRCRHRIDRHKDPLRAVERAEYFLAELWARGSIAIVADEAAGGLGLSHGSTSRGGSSSSIAEERRGKTAREYRWTLWLVE